MRQNRMLCPIDGNEARTQCITKIKELSIGAQLMLTQNLKVETFEYRGFYNGGLTKAQIKSSTNYLRNIIEIDINDNVAQRFLRQDIIDKAKDCDQKIRRQISENVCFMLYPYDANGLTTMNGIEKKLTERVLFS